MWVAWVRAAQAGQPVHAGVDAWWHHLLGPDEEHPPAAGSVAQVSSWPVPSGMSS
jgi:hypothetical protein